MTRFLLSQVQVYPMYDMVKSKPCFLKEAVVADKVVGKAAAALMISGGVDKVYAEVISLSALVLLRHEEIETDFGHVVPCILNRNKTDWCPLEKMCYQKESVKEILLLIEEFRRNIRIKELLQYEQI